MPVVFDDRPTSTPTPGAASARGRVVFEDDGAAAAPQARPAVSSPYGYFSPDVQRQTYGEDYGLPEVNDAMRGVANTLFAAQQDPGGTLLAVPAGINKGIAMLAGMPMDTLASGADLLGMGYGLGAEAATGRNAGEFYMPANRADVPLTGEWNSLMLDKLSTILFGGESTVNPRPDNPAATLLYNTAQQLPGAAGARQLAAAASGGALQAIAAQSGADPATQTIAGLIGNRAAETPRMPAPGSPFSREVLVRNAGTGQAEAPTFLPDSGGAAAAMPPQLQRVPREMRGPLVVALMRGDRDMAERVIDAETLPVPIRMMEGQARGDSALMADEFNLRGTDKEIAARFDEQNQGLIENLDTIRREVAPSVVGNDPRQNGQALIDAYKTMDEPVRAEITAAYKALEDANGGQLPINAKAFVDAADKALAAKLKTRHLPAAVRGDLDEIRDNGGMLTFEQFENLRTTLATAARDADRGVLGGGGNAAAAIRLVRDELENFPMDGAAPGLKVKEGNGTIEVNPEGGGHVFARLGPDGYYKISTSELPEAARGQGTGVAMYLQLVDNVLTRGGRVKSDSTVSQGAVNVYEALRRRGYDVRTNPRANKFDKDAGDGMYAPDGTAVFEIHGGPQKSANNPANLKALADRARSLSKARFDRIRDDPAYRAAVDDDTPIGESSALADDFVRKYVVGGKGANLARMRENLAADPVAAETIAASALNYVKSKSGVNPYTNEGNFSQAGFNKALAEIMPRINELMPDETAEIMQQLGRVAQNLQRQRKGGVFNNSGTYGAAAREAAKGYAEGTLNTLVPGANLGTFARQRRAEGRAKDRSKRALDPIRYLTEKSDE